MGRGQTLIRPAPLPWACIKGLAPCPYVCPQVCRAKDFTRQANLVGLVPHVVSPKSVALGMPLREGARAGASDQRAGSFLRKGSMGFHLFMALLLEAYRGTKPTKPPLFAMCTFQAAAFSQTFLIGALSGTSFLWRCRRTRGFPRRGLRPEAPWVCVAPLGPGLALGLRDGLLSGWVLARKAQFYQEGLSLYVA